MRRVYIDSSVIYGAPTKEFSQDSKRFWEAFRNGEFTLIVSEVLKIEMERAPQAAQEVFAEAESNGFEGVQSYQTTDSGHGRIETRTYYALPVPEDSALRTKWRNLETFGMGIFERTEKGETSTTIRFMISDLPAAQVKQMGNCFRSHWGIENKLHWVLDVSMYEDGNRTRRGNGAKNLGVLRRLALSLIRQVQSGQTVPNIMWRAALSPEFRTNIIEKIRFFRRISG